MKTGLIDYGRGNLHSVNKALEKVGCSVTRVSKAKEFRSQELLVFPGQGHFGEAMGQLKELGLIEPIREWIHDERPFLGICLGFQLLFEGSEETPEVDGLKIFKGTCVRFPETVGKVPHMGWNPVHAGTGNPFGKELFPEDDTDHFYHVHSYFPQGVEESVVASRTNYGGVDFVSGVARKNLAAFQFHPEKSQDAGLGLLRRYVEQLWSS